MMAIERDNPAFKEVLRLHAAIRDNLAALGFGGREA